LETITQIEGVVVIDGTPPTSIQGVGSGVVCGIGECADVTYGVQVSGGNVSTYAQPVQVVTDADLQGKIGGFDSSLGDFGDAGGNLLADLLGRRFATGLTVIPVNTAATKAVRLFRQLPIATSVSDPTPAVPVAAYTVPAGTLFQTSGGATPTRSAAAATFTADAYYASGTGLNRTSWNTSAVQHTLTRTSGSWYDDGVLVGDVITIGYKSVPYDAAYGTYRIVSITDATNIEVEKLDGAAFQSASSGTNMPWRVSPAATAYTGTGLAAVAAGYTIPARPMSASVSPATTLPAFGAPTESGVTLSTGWTPDVALSLVTQQGVGNGLTYVAGLHAANANNSTELNAAYSAAMQALLADADPASSVNIVFCSRSSRSIASALKTVVTTRSDSGRGMVALVAPGLSCITRAAATSSATGSATDSSFGVAATDAAGRSDRVIFNWLGVRLSLPAAVGSSIQLASGAYTTDGVIDVSPVGHCASTLSQLPPERNPGEFSDITASALSTVLGFQTSAPTLSINDYTLLKAAGVMSLRNDRTTGFVWQSGITSSLTAGRKNIARRRMADFIQDSVAERLNLYAKRLLTQDLKDATHQEVDGFLSGLESVDQPERQRIARYSVDVVSGNTPELEAQGVFVIVGKVRTLASADDIVFNTQIGESVVVDEA
jgi:hypothetical protein